MSARLRDLECDQHGREVTDGGQLYGRPVYAHMAHGEFQFCDQCRTGQRQYLYRHTAVVHLHQLSAQWRNCAAVLGDGHQGLAGMRERAELRGGSFAIDSAPGRGTTVRILLKPAADDRATR